MFFTSLLARTASQFTIIQCESERLKNEAYRIRYQVYCEEFGWEPKNNDKREVDVFDKCAKQFVIVDRTTACVIGTFRIVRGNGIPTSYVLPADNVFHPNNASQYGLVSELGRFALLPDYRNTELTYAMILYVAYAAAKMGIMSGYMIMEKRLCSLISVLGAKPCLVSGDIELKGKRQVYMLNTSDVLRELTLQLGFSHAALDELFDKFKA